MENRYSLYLPEMVRDLKEFRKLGEVEGLILEDAAGAKDTLIRNQWILTAERSGLLRLAKMMKLQGAEWMETETLRQEILYRWSCRRPYTLFHLQDWLDNCLGTENYSLRLERDNYRLQVILELRVQEQQEFLQKYLRRVIPANLILDVDLHLNTYGDLKKTALTYGRLQELALTYGQIPYEDLKIYRK